MNHPRIDRRAFVKGAAATAGALGLATAATSSPAADAPTPDPHAAPARPDYAGPNVIVVRFGGGVRRRESIDPEHTYAPWMRHELAQRGTLLTDMTISSEEGVETSHGQGTLNILTGIYDDYKDVEGKFLGGRFEAKVPTLFEYFRKAYNVPAESALLINGEDRTDEEFYSFSNHHLFGVNYRCSVLSLYRFKCHLLRRQIDRGGWDDKTLKQKQAQLAKLEALDYRKLDRAGQGPELEAFWEAWRRHYGESGLKNPRGDRLLTELAVWAIRRLRPRFMMINYNDPDYVHWGNMAHYTTGVAIIDRELRRLVEVTDQDEFYAGRTVFAVVPDCGRDDNRFTAVPCQHHFNSAESRRIFGLFVGPGIDKGVVVDKPCEQIGVAPTIGRLMGIRTPHVNGDVLGEVFA